MCKLIFNEYGEGLTIGSLLTVNYRERTSNLSIIRGNRQEKTAHNGYKIVPISWVISALLIER